MMRTALQSLQSWQSPRLLNYFIEVIEHISVKLMTAPVQTRAVLLLYRNKLPYRSRDILTGNIGFVRQYFMKLM